MMSVSRDMPHVCSTFYLVRNEVFEIRSAEILVKSFPVDLLVDRKLHEDVDISFLSSYPLYLVHYLAHGGHSTNDGVDKWLNRGLHL